MNIAAHLDAILGTETLTPLFQPIVSCRQQLVYGYESLIRGPSDSPLHAPLSLFDAAEREGRLPELDFLCRRLALEQFAARNLPGRLFINVTPDALESSGFRRGQTQRFLKHLGIPPERVVIELTERHPISNYDVMRAAVSHYRSMGFAIAIDDLGAGYSSLRHWSELRPEFVKVDRHFVEGIHDDAVKREFVRSILDIARGIGTEVVAEGIETLEEYRCLWTMGLRYGQGYYFARPMTNPPREIATGLPGDALELAQVAGALRETAASVAVHAPVVRPAMRTDDVAALFREQESLQTVVVCDDENRPLGAVRRAALQALYASDYGRALHAKRSVLKAAETDILRVPHDLPLEKLSKQITESEALGAEHVFLVLDDAGRYLGVGYLLNLLRRITELKVQYARYANPLTQLPGNVPVNRHIDTLLSAGEHFTVIYADLDHFKPFNDSYGYARGDDVLMTLADLLRTQADSERDFVGHLGGDDFMIVYRSADWRRRCDQVLTTFERLAPWFYEDRDRQAGGLQALDRQGASRFFPVLSLSMAAIPVDPRSHFLSHQEIAGLMPDVKSAAKRQAGNSLFIDRRDHARAEQMPLLPQTGSTS